MMHGNLHLDPNLDIWIGGGEEEYSEELDEEFSTGIRRTINGTARQGAKVSGKSGLQISRTERRIGTYRKSRSCISRMGNDSSGTV